MLLILSLMPILIEIDHNNQACDKVIKINCLPFYE
jgi:hypothetical protein